MPLYTVDSLDIFWTDWAACLNVSTDEVIYEHDWSSSDQILVELKEIQATEISSVK